MEGEAAPAVDPMSLQGPRVLRHPRPRGAQPLCGVTVRVGRVRSHAGASASDRIRAGLGRGTFGSPRPTSSRRGTRPERLGARHPVLRPGWSMRRGDVEVCFGGSEYHRKRTGFHADLGGSSGNGRTPPRPDLGPVTGGRTWTMAAGVRCFGRARRGGARRPRSRPGSVFGSPGPSPCLRGATPLRWGRSARSNAGAFRRRFPAPVSAGAEGRCGERAVVTFELALRRGHLGDPPGRGSGCGQERKECAMYGFETG